MRYRRTRIPGTGPPTPPELVLHAHPESELRVGGDGRVTGGVGAQALDRELRAANMVLRPVFGGRARLRDWAGRRVEGAPCDAPDLSTYYRIVPAAGGHLPDDPAGLNEQLRGYDAVDAAYLRPPTVLPVLPTTEADLLPIGGSFAATEDFSGLQGYLNPASDGGIDARYAWTIAGGDGNGTTIVDVERAWRMTHEDLDMAGDDLMGGIPVDDPEARNHGTAVAGILAATHDDRGVMGISPGADVKGMAVTGDFIWSCANAIREAAERLRPGDIILIEQMAPGPRVILGDEDPQFGYIPVEWWPLDLDAIQYASSLGIIVVEAAGNGTQDLDDDVYEIGALAFGTRWRNPLRGGGRDTGAILVGAGAPPPGAGDRDWGPDRSRLDYSNWGTRVDVQAWGRAVTTTGGYGSGPDALRPVWDEDGWYTNRFSGTSSAAPMVAGALACTQGMLRAHGRPPLMPEEARKLLRETGAPQEHEHDRVSRWIGPRPDLRSMVERVFDGAPLQSRGVKARRRRSDSMGKVTITIESEGEITSVSTQGGSERPVQVQTRSNGSSEEPSDLLTLIGLIGKITYEFTQRKGPARS
jgi:hypothetical protein